MAADYPLHVVCEWIGNSAAIASQHYLTVTDEDYLRAAQNAAQSVHEQGCKTLQEKKTDERKPLVLQSAAPLSDLVRNCIVPPRGVEPLSPP